MLHVFKQPLCGSLYVINRIKAHAISTTLYNHLNEHLQQICHNVMSENVDVTEGGTVWIVRWIPLSSLHSFRVLLQESYVLQNKRLHHHEALIYDTKELIFLVYMLSDLFFVKV